MPTRPPTSCRNPYCPQPAVRDGWCVTHYTPAFAGHHQPMPPGWATVRAAVLRRDHHRCVDCGAPATSVDHITPRALGGAMLNPANLASVCKHCHDLRTAALLARMRAT